MSFSWKTGESEQIPDSPVLIEYDMPGLPVVISLMQQVEYHYSTFPPFIPKVLTFTEHKYRVTASFKPENSQHHLVRQMIELAKSLAALGQNVVVSQQFKQEEAINVRVLSCEINAAYFYLFARTIGDFLVMMTTPGDDGKINLRCAYFSAPNDRSFEQVVHLHGGKVLSSETFGVTDISEIGTVIGTLLAGQVSSSSQKQVPIRNIRVRDDE